MDQWAMDFESNKQRIVRSIVVAKERGARYRVGPELEITGYGCEDHFLEDDTFRHSWEARQFTVRRPRALTAHLHVPGPRRDPLLRHHRGLMASLPLAMFCARLLTPCCSCQGIVCDFGMPVLYQGVRYNCRVLCHNGKVLFIRSANPPIASPHCERRDGPCTYLPPRAWGGCQAQDVARERWELPGDALLYDVGQPQ